MSNEGILPLGCFCPAYHLSSLNFSPFCGAWLHEFPTYHLFFIICSGRLLPIFASEQCAPPILSLSLALSLALLLSDLFPPLFLSMS